MSFAYTTIKTESLAYGTRVYRGYNTVGGGGVIFNTRLYNESVGGPPMKDQEVFLPSDTVAGLITGMSGSPFTTLLTEDLGQNAVRYVRAYQTPGGNVLFHHYTVITSSVSGKTNTTTVDDFFLVLTVASISGTDIVKV